MLGFAVTVFPREHLIGSFFFYHPVDNSVQLSSVQDGICVRIKPYNVLHPISQQLDAKIHYDFFLT